MDTQEPEKLGTPQKALLINLNAAVFGSFAEIGAGQEVARWFLRVGGASGTVAKTISAYDKEVSDDLYGSGTRYVSKPRLQAMMKNEWEQLLGQLAVTRGATTRFFSFVDTISARNFSRRVSFFLLRNSAFAKLGWCCMPTDHAHNQRPIEKNLSKLSNSRCRLNQRFPR